MTYSIDIDPQAQESIAALPTDALLALTEAFTLLELSPWSGQSVNAEKNPDAPVRNLPFGRAGLLTYLVLDDEQRVDVRNHQRRSRRTTRVIGHPHLLHTQCM